MQTAGFLRAFWALTKPYWVSEQRAKALTLLVTVVGLVLAMVWMEVQFNYWNRDFYNTFESRNQAEFFRQLGKFGLLAGTPKFVCSRRTRSSRSGSTAATRSRWLSQFRPRVGYQSCAAPPRASGSKPLGKTSAALGKRAWNLNAIGIIDCAVAPQPCRKTNR